MFARILCSTAILAGLGSAAAADTTFHILHFNDFHSRIQPINRYDSTCPAEDDAAGECFGGIARIQTAIQQMEAEYGPDNVAVMVAGDIFQGSQMYTTFHGDVEAEMMQAIGLDVMALGNHEFDDGPENLGRVLEQVDFPVISGNLDLSMSDALRDRVSDSVVLDIAGIQVGVVSALTTDTMEISSPGPNVLFQNEIEALQQDVDDLTAQGVDVIIALTHVGEGEDEMIASQVTGIDAVVGGHSNTYFSASDEDRDYAYPLMVSNPEGTMVPVVSAYAYGKYLGHLELTVDDAGNLIYAGGDTILLDASFQPDATLTARVEELAAPIEEAMSVVVSSSTASIDGNRDSCRARECEMGVLVTTAMLDRTRAQGMDVAITNGGGLRASIDAGDITMGEVLTVLPFQNTLSTFQLTGAGVIEALENGVSQVEEGAGRFPQVAGMRYTWDPEAEPGSRIVSVEIETADGFVPIDPEVTYGVVSNNFMRAGGDGYSVFANDGMNAYDYGPGLEQVVADYLTENGPYEPHLEGRVMQAQ
ncbi:bifunctional metallophosphatase/5'-nucleotidase [Nioella nitratireducens]|uniref:bifunctional metallophosphatase/5'-nucleotidase n=1 Tax=Nioella nitratireducens TaxID=1287720 RepID=UPI0008FD6CFA|nr:5'-nucleotidase C-terminal domain-containing protein [Nioella nitratireducens]